MTKELTNIKRKRPIPAISPILQKWSVQNILRQVTYSFWLIVETEEVQVYEECQMKTVLFFSNSSFLIICLWKIAII